MQSAVLQRIRTLIDYLSLSDRKFAESIGISASTLSSLFARNSDPNTSVVIAILSVYAYINSDWLILGKGEMLKSNINEGIVSTNISTEGQPFYDVDFVGGFDVMCNNQTIQPSYYINYRPYNKEGVMWVNLTGKSMEPELNHGDLIALKEATTAIEYLPLGEVYAIVTDDFRTVKRLSKSDKEGFVRLIPSNKSEEYAPQDIPVSIIRKVFYVLGSIKNL